MAPGAASQVRGRFCIGWSSPSQSATTNAAAAKPPVVRHLTAATSTRCRRSRSRSHRRASATVGRWPRASRTATDAVARRRAEADRRPMLDEDARGERRRASSVDRTAGRSRDARRHAGSAPVPQASGAGAAPAQPAPHTATRRPITLHRRPPSSSDADGRGGHLPTGLGVEAVACQERVGPLATLARIGHAGQRPCVLGDQPVGGSPIRRWCVRRARPHDARRARRRPSPGPRPSAAARRGWRARRAAWRGRATRPRPWRTPRRRACRAPSAGRSRRRRAPAR